MALLWAIKRSILQWKRPFNWIRVTHYWVAYLFTPIALKKSAIKTNFSSAEWRKTFVSIVKLKSAEIMISYTLTGSLYVQTNRDMLERLFAHFSMQSIQWMAWSRHEIQGHRAKPVWLVGRRKCTAAACPRTRCPWSGQWRCGRRDVCAWTISGREYHRSSLSPCSPGIRRQWILVSCSSSWLFVWVSTMESTSQVVIEQSVHSRCSRAKLSKATANLSCTATTSLQLNIWWLTRLLLWAKPRKLIGVQV